MQLRVAEVASALQSLSKTKIFFQTNVLLYFLQNVMEKQTKGLFK